MGLASKLQAAQGGMNTLAAAGMPPGGQPGTYAPSAPPYPTAPQAGSIPYQTSPGPYPSPYPRPQVNPQQMGPYPAGSVPQGPYGSMPTAQYGAAPQAMGGSAPYGTAPQAMPAAPYGTAPQNMGGNALPGANVSAPYPGMMPPPANQTLSQPPQQFAPTPQSGMMPAGPVFANSGLNNSNIIAAGPAPMGGMVGAILSKLQSCVSTNQLDRFYSPASLQALAARLDGRVNFRELAARWQMPVELALDLAALSLYDTVIFADDSGSMTFEENGERIDDLKMIAQKVAEVATLFDDDGILVRFMNSNTQGNAIRSPADVGSLLSQVQYAGLTPLATSLQSKVLQPIVFTLAASGQLAKPVLIITITDGEPTDNPKDLVVQVIKDARTRLSNQYGPKAVAFEFCQVGKDQRAQAFLAQLDADPQVGSSIDCTSYFELESTEYQKRGINLSPSMWLVKMMVGAIDLSHDKGDEQP